MHPVTVLQTSQRVLVTILPSLPLLLRRFRLCSFQETCSSFCTDSIHRQNYNLAGPLSFLEHPTIIGVLSCQELELKLYNQAAELKAAKAAAAAARGGSATDLAGTHLLPTGPKSHLKLDFAHTAIP